MNIAVLPGDGIGPEVMAEAVKALEAVAERFGLQFHFDYADVGGCAIDRHGCALPPQTLKICRASAAILFGSVGGPKWESLPPRRAARAGGPVAPAETLRPVLQPAAGAARSGFRRSQSPAPRDRRRRLRRALRPRVDRRRLLRPTQGRDGAGSEQRAFDTMSYNRRQIERIARAAFRLAAARRRRVASIDKANILTTMVLWREVVAGVGAEHPEIALEHLYVDNAAMQLIRDPGRFDVLLCGNMYGDILSDELAALCGSIGMLPSASLNEQGFGLYEPIGGAAPELTGRNVANPIAQILSAAMLLRHSLDRDDAARAIEAAVDRVLTAGLRTAEMAAPGTIVVGTAEMGDAVAAEILSTSPSPSGRGLG